MTPDRASEQAEKAVVAAAMLFWGFSVKDIMATVLVNGMGVIRDYGAFLETPKKEQTMHFFGKGIYGTRHKIKLNSLNGLICRFGIRLIRNVTLQYWIE